MLREMPRVVRDGRFILSAISLLLFASSAQSADEALHTRIDGLIDSARVGPVAELASDAEFLRRLSLDLRGTIPTTGEIRKFLADESQDKRTVWVDRFLNSPDYVRHMADVFDVMLMERRGDTHIKTDPWKQYLRESLEQNKPYNVLAKEILAADGADEKLRPAARFFLDRTVEPNLMTRDIGRIFFGRDFQCAQCHDHPLIDDYLQSDYYGIYAFVDRSYLFTDKDKKVFVAEKPDSVVKFQSVFDPDAAGETAPALPGEAELLEPHFKRGEEYSVAPAKNVRPIPQYSRRSRLAELATSGENAAFNRNIANRLWAHMLGLGLVEPVDLHHPENPPSHPELLSLLADEFVAMSFDVKAFLRELALTRTYQRSFEQPATDAELAAAAAMALPELKSRQEQLEAAAGELDERAYEAREAWSTAKEQIAPLSEELAQAKAAVGTALKPANEAGAALSKAQGELKAKQELARLLSEALPGAKSAAQKLPEDQELAKAAALFEARAAKVSGELPALETQVEEKSAAAKQANEALTVADQKVEELAARLQEQRKPVHDANERFAQLDRQRKAGLALANTAAKRVAAAERLVDYGERLATLSPAKQSVEEAQAAREAAAQLVATRQAAMSDPKTTLDQAKQVEQAAAETLAAAKQQMQTRQETVAIVAEAVAKTESALEKLPGDAALTQAAETLNSRLAGLTAEAAQYEQTTLNSARADAQAAGQQVASAEGALATATAELTAAQQQLTAAETRLQTAADEAAATEAALETSLTELTATSSRRFALASLTPLTPEQFALSTMRATGAIERQRAAVEAELKKAQADKAEKEKAEKAAAAKAEGKEPPKAEDTPTELPPIDPAEIERALQEKLKGPVKAFVKLFGAGSGQPQNDFFATVDQALFLANGGTVKSWLAPSGGNLTDRLVKQEDPGALAEELYLSVLTRRPTPSETEAVADYLAQRPEDKSAAVQEMTWALLTSTEFRFKH